MRLKKSKERKILEQVAANNGVTLDEVRHEIEIAMNMAAQDSLSADKAGQQSVFHNRPMTPEIFVCALSEETKHRLQVQTAD